MTTKAEPLEKEFGLVEGMHGLKGCMRSTFIKCLLDSIEENYVVFRSYCTTEVFNPKVILCGYIHRNDSIRELKKVLDKIVSEEDVILLEGYNKVVRKAEEYPIEGDPFVNFVGNIKRIEFNDDVFRLALQAQINVESLGFVNLAKKRDKYQLGPSIVKTAMESKTSKVYQRIGLRHLVEWLEIFLVLERNKMAYTSIIPKEVPYFTEIQRKHYYWLARKSAEIDFKENMQ
ncbi:MAG: hypothetical protein KAT43_06190 [Nanoarchaeota archaeon]|nr:hypothetical protein [Nanoarchaeota archaeon]